MKIAIIGASGKTGIWLVRESLKRGYQVVAVCRNVSKDKLDEFASHHGFTIITAPVVSDEVMLSSALSGCNAVIAILMTVRDLKATELVSSLVKATATHNVRRLVFTAGEVTAVPEKGENFTLRQRLLEKLGRLISLFTPYSMTDMVKASVMIRELSDWEWTIVRAPTLRETQATGYSLCEISEVTSKHFLSREDYAVCMVDSLSKSDHYRRILTVVSSKQ
jgi:putative NADH-flavin reductase